MRAYIDESVRENAPGLYVLAAVVVPAPDVDDVRRTLHEGLRHSRPRFHWRDEEQTDREAMAKTIGGLQLGTVVAAAAPMGRDRQERARRLCLVRLLWELEQRQVHDVLLESRRSRDHKDRACVLAAQRAGHLSEQLRYAFGSPHTEPLLWLPDLVAGAVAAARTGLDAQTLPLLGASVSVVDVGAAG